MSNKNTSGWITLKLEIDKLLNDCPSAVDYGDLTELGILVDSKLVKYDLYNEYLKCKTTEY